MGWGARANRDSTQGKDERETMEIMLRRRVRQFATREAFETYCEHGHVTTQERIYLETLLPAHLTVYTPDVKGDA